MREHPVGIIGAGRVGTALGRVLIRSGYHVTGIAARSAGSRDRAARMLPGTPILEPAEVARSSGILVVSVADDAIERVCAGLAVAGCFRAGHHVLHLSGARGLAVLRPAAEAGAMPLAIHPAMTFPGLDTDADRLAGLAYAITTRPAERPRAEEFVVDLGGVPIWIAEEDRTLYHAALVLGANNLIAPTASAMEALAAAGVPDPGFVLAPLARASLENALRTGDEALTGPVRRADTGTIDAHLRVLRERAPDLVPAYLQFGLVTADRARRAALTDADRLARVIAVLRHEAAEVHQDP
ncbi:MAG: DUF2520 domain-containing protein [Dactylosporangium sp.]|nr:DUF2520 domain-containing protein [Dactylosporangium sp.]